MIHVYGPPLDDANEPRELAGVEERLCLGEAEVPGDTPTTAVYHPQAILFNTAPDGVVFVCPECLLVAM